MPALRTIAVFLITAVGLGSTVPAQQPLKLSVVLSAFLADSGVPTRGLDWSTGSGLSIHWETARPVAAAEWLRRQGYTLSRTGKANIVVGRLPAQEMEIQLWGTLGGLQKTNVMFELNEITMDLVEQALTQDGFALQPLKCDRSKEGASYGNAVYVAKAPGKTASGLHESWNCAHDGCTGTLSILYRKADVSTVECIGT